MHTTGMSASSDHNVSPPLFGREREETLLRQQLDAMLQGCGRLLLVSGEAGIGKTTLVNRVAGEATRAGALVLTGHCYDLTATPPYGPWSEIAERYRANDQLPEIPDVLKRGTGMAGITNQSDLFDVARDFLASVAASRPLMLVLEDLHWSDSPSLDLLRYVARVTSDLQVMIVATYRSDEITSDNYLYEVLPRIIRESNPERFDLRPLSRSGVRDLVQTRYALNKSDEERLVEFLIQRCEGNPLYVSEQLRTLVNDHDLVEEEGFWHLRDLLTASTPMLLRQIIGSRIARLDAATIRALQVAATIGHEVPLGTWSSIVSVSDAAQAEVIQQALHARLLVEHGDPSILAFSHALVREALYLDIPLPLRTSMHLAVAEELARNESARPDKVAYHFNRANDPRVVEWLLAAGDQASLLFAGITASDRYSQALSAMERFAWPIEDRVWMMLKVGIWSRDTSPKSAIVHLEQAVAIARRLRNRPLVAASLWHLGLVKFFVGHSGIPELEQATAAFAELSSTEIAEAATRFPGSALVTDRGATMALMLALAGRLSESRSMAEKYLRSSYTPDEQWQLNERGHAEAALIAVHNATGHTDEAQLAYERSKAYHERAGNYWHRALHATLHFHYGTATYRLDDIAAREAQIAEIAHLWSKASGVATALPPDFGLLPDYLLRGSWDEAVEIVAESLTFDLVFHAIGLYVRGTIARLRGEMDVAWKMVHTRLPDSSYLNPAVSPHFFAMEMQRLAAELSLDDRDVARARYWLDCHDQWLEWEQGRMQGKAEGLLIWARYYDLSENCADARHYAELSLARASIPEQPLALIAAHRFLGELETSERRFGEAEGHLQESLRLADACATPFERALTLLPLAQLRAANGEVDEALNLVDEVVCICEPLNARPTLDRARNLTNRLTDSHVRSRRPAGLTTREVEVLRLVAKGMSDREIADALFISRHTVMRHVSHILAKLEVDSRAAAAAMAVRLGVAQ